jgi:NADH-quinone oxidoreductase subunit L
MPQYTAAVQQLIRVDYLWLIPFFPALGALINLLFGAKLQRRYGKGPIHAVAVGSMVLSSLLAISYFIQLLRLDPSSRFLLNELFPMIHAGALRVNMAFALDPLSAMMVTMITVVATAIHIYSTGYMHHEPSYWRFFGYLNLFCFSMLMLILGENFVLMFFGWEGVGLCSYLLIGFWYQDREKARCGMKAFIVNRIGDFGFIIGLFTLFWGLLGVWDAAPGEQPHTLSDGRCLSVLARGLDEGKGGHGAPSAHEKAGEAHGAVAHGSSAEDWGPCGQEAAARRGFLSVKERKQGPVAIGEQRQLYLGPTVSFRELRDQLSVEDQHQTRVIANALRESTLWFGIPLLIFITFGFFLGATGKSAQIPLYVWLPDAMAGPTPVSALIHAATMVTAGVYMVARLNFIFILSPEGMTLVAVIGALTALFAATIGLFQYDIKRVLAYSTVSQLGYMFVGVGVGAWWVGIYHLLTHAFFKACLFLGSGSVIHGMHWVEHRHHHAPGHEEGDPSPAAHDAEGASGHDAPPVPHPPTQSPSDPRWAPNPCDPQDMRNMGGLASLMPWTRWTYLIACLAISGIPFLSGFYSKDEILWKAFATGNLSWPWIGKLIWLCCALGAGCTAFYMFRSYYLTFWGRAASEEHRHHVHESPRSMTYVLAFLAAGAILMSLIGSTFFVPAAITHQHPWIEHFLAPTMAISEALQRPATETRASVELMLMVLSVVIAAGGIGFARLMYKDLSRTGERLEGLKRSFSGLHRLIFNKYFIDEIYAATVLRGFLLLSRILAWFDLWIVDGLVNACGWVLRVLASIHGAIDAYLVDGAVNGVADSVIGLGRRLRRVQSGRINGYVMGVTFGVVVLLFIVWSITPSMGQ